VFAFGDNCLYPEGLKYKVSQTELEDMIFSRYLPPGLLIPALVCTLLVGSTDALAARVSGSVTEAGGDLTLPEVSITLDGAGVSRDILSDYDGKFESSDLPAGSYRLTFKAFGYRDQTRDIELTEDQDLVLDVALVLDAVRIDDVLVVGQTSDIESDIQTGYVSLDAKTLESIPGVIEPDPLRALQILPGVQAASDISSGLYIRGGGPDQTLVMMDGVTVYNPTHAFGFFSTFNNDAVEDVDLYKGAYPAEYGGRLGAVLDVDMREPDSEKVRGKAGISIISARVSLEGGLGPDNWLVAGRRSFLDPLLNALSTEENPIPSYYFYDVNATYTTRRLGGLTTLQIYNGKDDVKADADINTAFELSWGNTVFMLRHERYLTDQLEGRLTLSNSRYNSTTGGEFLATAIGINNKLNDVTAAGVLDWQASREHRLNFGLSYSWYKFIYQQSFNQTPQIDYDSRPNELAAFVEDRWFPDDDTTVRTGLRYLYLEDRDKSLFEPRLSFSRMVSPQVRLKLGGGIYNQYLQLVTTEGFSAGDFYLPLDGSVELGQSWQVVLGGEWEPTGRDLISLEVYNTGLEGLVEFDNRVPADQATLTADELFVTGGKGYARGMELFVRHTADRWTGWLGYTLGYTQRTFAELNGGDSFVPKYDRRHDINALVSYQAGKWKLAASFRYATGQAFTPASARYSLDDPATGGEPDAAQVLAAPRNSGRLLPYNRLDLSARKPFGLFGLPAEFVIEIFNVYNRRNEWFVTYDTDGEITEATVVRMLPVIPSVGVNFEF